MERDHVREMRRWCENVGETLEKGLNPDPGSNTLRRLPVTGHPLPTVLVTALRLNRVPPIFPYSGHRAYLVSALGHDLRKPGRQIT